MGDRKIEMDIVESSIARQATFSKYLAGVLKEVDALASLADVLKEVDALARQSNVRAALFISPGRFYVFRSPCHNSMVGHIRNRKLRRKNSLLSLKQARILKDLAKLERVTEKLEREKEREKALKKMQQEPIEKRKKSEDLELEELIAFKENFEALLEKLKGIYIVGETSLSAYVDTLKE